MVLSDTLTLDVIDGVGVITIDSPPVNALGHRTRVALDEGFRKFGSDPAVKAIVLMCGGRTFFAGADISELGKPLQPPMLEAVLDVMENGSRPVIAAIHGTALGGGYELSLCCHYRIAVPSAKIGLPEVNLGLIPGGGGTQRLPRLVGPQAALEIMSFGKPLDAKKALELGMIDALAEEGRLREDAIAFARKVLAEGKPLSRVRDRQDKVAQARGQPEIYETFLKANKAAFRGLKAPVAIAKAVEAAVELPFDKGIDRERELFRELIAGTQSAALRYYFFSERQAAKVPDVPADTPTRPIAKVGVIGAGTMGGGITMNFINVGVPVTLVEMNEDALQRGIGVVRKNYENTVRKGRLTQEQLEKRMALITPALDLSALADVDLVIEAVFEDMAIKKDIFGKLDKIAKPGAILATNTSFLDVNEIAASTSRPGDVLGMHFFSPANVMRLLEMVRGEKTSKDVLASILGLAKTIGKVPVVAGVCHGFIANRAMSGRRADTLLLEGATPEQVDNAVYDFGFAMGPFRMSDLAGLDIVARNRSDGIEADLVKLGRLGQKSNAGYYDYDEKRNATPSPVAAKVIADYAAAKGVTPGAPPSAEEIIFRMLCPVVNEGAKILEEGVAIRASDIDVALILGYGWPVYTGGPMFWADTVGLPKIIERLKGLGIEPAKLLVEKAAAGERLTG